MMHNVFVYGTLKSGYWNHRCLAGATEGPIKTRTKHANYDMFGDGIPYVTEGGTKHIVGEMYRVSDDILKGPLDSLEGHPHAYERREVELDNGETAWLYFYDNPPSGRSSIVETEEGLMYARS